MSMVFYDLPIFALGSEEEVNETISVSIFVTLFWHDCLSVFLYYSIMLLLAIILSLDI